MLHLINSSSKNLCFNEYFLCWAVYPSVMIHHKIWTFMIYDSAGREKNNFQELSKLIELIFISTA